MSHELRTPLNGVLGYTQLLQRDRGLRPAQREALEAIGKCGTHLLELINDVLDLSRIEAGRVDIEATTTDLAQLLIDSEVRRRRGGAAEGAPAVDDHRARRAATRGARRAPPPPGAAQPARQRRQVHRAGRGAARRSRRWTTTGSTSRSATPASASSPTPSHASSTRSTRRRDGAAAGGTGLGLTISRHLIQTMGDELRVESTPGRGQPFLLRPAARLRRRRAGTRRRG